MKIIVGTRGSKLALTQTKWVISQLQMKNPEIEFDIKIITTTGDQIQNVSLDKIGEKGVFVKEIEEQLIKKEIDFAVHSMKDMPGLLPPELMFSWVPKREDFRDALIFKEGYSTLNELPLGAKVATGSKRREYQLLKIRPDLTILPIRGNIDTRIRKLKEQNLDAIVLAAAGLKRIGIYYDIKERIQLLEPELVLPSPAQGALALEIRKDSTHLHEIIETISDYESYLQVSCERAFLRTIGGSCHIPIGALCSVKGEEIELTGLLGNEDGSVLIKRTKKGKREEGEKIGVELAQMILKEMENR